MISDWYTVKAYPGVLGIFEQPTKGRRWRQMRILFSHLSFFNGTLYTLQKMKGRVTYSRSSVRMLSNPGWYFTTKELKRACHAGQFEILEEPCLHVE